MSLPEIASSHEKLQKETDRFRQTETQIQHLYEEWEKLSEEVSE